MRLLVLLIVAFQLLASGIASSRILDPSESSDELLDGLSDELDKRMIDVKRGSVDAFSPIPSGSRAVILRLEHFTPDPKLARNAEFTRLFYQGVFQHAFLLAVGPVQTPTDNEIEIFRKEWSSQEKSKRVFISFSGRDMAFAQSVAKILHDHGFSTFLYKGQVSEEIRFNSADVGNFFDQAGHRLLIDTKNARSSGAIAAEALAARGIAPTTVEPDIHNLPPIVNRTTSQPCCKLCTARNGVILSCGPTICGAECGLPTRLAPDSLSSKPNLMQFGGQSVN